jgi:hypothetical protein
MYFFVIALTRLPYSLDSFVEEFPPDSHIAGAKIYITRVPLYPNFVYPIHQLRPGPNRLLRSATGHVMFADQVAHQVLRTRQLLRAFVVSD